MSSSSSPSSPSSSPSPSSSSSSSSEDEFVVIRHSDSDDTSSFHSLSDSEGGILPDEEPTTTDISNAIAAAESDTSVTVTENPVTVTENPVTVTESAAENPVTNAADALLGSRNGLILGLVKERYWYRFWSVQEKMPLYAVEGATTDMCELLTNIGAYDIGDLAGAEGQDAFHILQEALPDLVDLTEKAKMLMEIVDERKRIKLNNSNNNSSNNNNNNSNNSSNNSNSSNNNNNNNSSSNNTTTTNVAGYDANYGDKYKYSFEDIFGPTTDSTRSNTTKNEKENKNADLPTAATDSYFSRFGFDFATEDEIFDTPAPITTPKKPATKPEISRDHDVDGNELRGRLPLVPTCESSDGVSPDSSVAVLESITESDVLFLQNVNVLTIRQFHFAWSDLLPMIFEFEREHYKDLKHEATQVMKACVGATRVDKKLPVKTHTGGDDAAVKTEDATVKTQNAAVKTGDKNVARGPPKVPPVYTDTVVEKMPSPAAAPIQRQVGFNLVEVDLLKLPENGNTSIPISAPAPIPPAAVATSAPESEPDADKISRSDRHSNWKSAGVAASAPESDPDEDKILRPERYFNWKSDLQIHYESEKSKIEIGYDPAAWRDQDLRSYVAADVEKWQGEDTVLALRKMNDDSARLWVYHYVSEAVYQQIKEESRLKSAYALFNEYMECSTAERPFHAWKRIHHSYVRDAAKWMGRKVEINQVSDADVYSFLVWRASFSFAEFDCTAGPKAVYFTWTPIPKSQREEALAVDQIVAEDIRDPYMADRYGRMIAIDLKKICSQHAGKIFRAQAGSDPDVIDTNHWIATPMELASTLVNKATNRAARTEMWKNFKSGETFFTTVPHGCVVVSRGSIPLDCLMFEEDFPDFMHTEVITY